MSDLLKQDTRNENIFVLSLMSGETTPIYFSTYIGERFFDKVLKHCRSNWYTYKPEDHTVLYRSPECIGYAKLE